MTLNYYNFISIHKNCVSVFFLYSLKLEVSISSLCQTFLERITGQMEFVVAYTCSSEHYSNHTGWNRPLPNSLSPHLLSSQAHTPFLPHLTLSHPLAAVLGRSEAATVGQNMPPFVKTHDKHTHTEAGKGWVGHSRCGTLPKPMHRHTHRHKHVETGPLAMEIFRGRSEFQKGKSIFQPELPYVN